MQSELLYPRRSRFAPNLLKNHLDVNINAWSMKCQERPEPKKLLRAFQQKDQEPLAGKENYSPRYALRISGLSSSFSASSSRVIVPVSRTYPREAA